MTLETVERRAVYERHDRLPTGPENGDERGRSDHEGPAASGTRDRRRVAGRRPAQQAIAAYEVRLGPVEDERPVGELVQR